MGAWGVGVFEDDTACDYAAEVAGTTGTAKLESTLDRILTAGGSSPESPECEEAVAAADIIARLKGKFGDRTAYTEEIDKWVESIKLAPSDALVEKARRTIVRIVTGPSELRDLWSESGELESWKSSLEGVLQRL
jgi:uncharacterized protein DUF4259